MAKPITKRPVLKDHSQMIDVLGGPTRVSEALFGTPDKRHVVGMWKYRGMIAAGSRPRISTLLAKAGYGVDETFLSPVHGNMRRQPDDDQDEADTVFGVGLIS